MLVASSKSWLHTWEAIHDLLEPKWPGQWKLMSLAKLLCLLGPQHGQPSMPDKQIPMWVLPSGCNAGWGVSHFSRFQSCLFFYEVLFIGGSHHSTQSPVEVVKHYAYNNDGPWVIDFLALTWQWANGKTRDCSNGLEEGSCYMSCHSQAPAVSSIDGKTAHDNTLLSAERVEARHLFLNFTRHQL